jgi:hypothetical protein
VKALATALVALDESFAALDLEILSWERTWLVWSSFQIQEADGEL